jgi:cytochrome P450
VAIVGAANRDPRQFPEPDRMEFARPTGRHLSFGLGTHYCIGASLARLELGLALSELVRKLPGMHLVEDPAAIKWQNNSVLPGPVRVLIQA